MDAIVYGVFSTPYIVLGSIVGLVVIGSLVSSLGGK
jgi:hypothetical protein